MNIDALKEALPSETFDGLNEYVSDLIGQRDQARNESISGRKSLKERLAELETQQNSVFDLLGVESYEDLLDKPQQGQEQDKQYEAKLKRLQRELDEKEKATIELTGQLRENKKTNILNSALSQHEFVAKDLIEAYVSRNLMWEGDELFYKSEDGNIMSVQDGVATMAKKRPELLKPVGAGGAGVRSSNARSVGEDEPMTRAEFEALSPIKQVEAAKAGVQLID